MRHLEGVHPGLEGIARGMSRSETIPLTGLSWSAAHLPVPIQDSGTSDNRRA
jgi:hypothetical protein